MLFNQRLTFKYFILTFPYAVFLLGKLAIWKNSLIKNIFVINAKIKPKKVLEFTLAIKALQLS